VRATVRGNTLLFDQTGCLMAALGRTPTVKKRLTRRLVQSARPGKIAYIIWDTSLTNFGLRLYPSGKRSYVIQYRPEGQRLARKMVVGGADVLTPEHARKRAADLLADVADGADPLAERQERAEVPTVAELAQRYLQQHAAVKKKASSASMDKATLRRHVLPALGQQRVTDVTRGDVERLHYGLRKIPVMANRVLALLSKMFNLAERWELRDEGSNPCRHVERYREHRRERFLSDAEYQRLGAVLSEAERTQTEHPSVIAAVRLIALTGCRRGEILGLRWEDLDLENGWLLIQDSKTGKKTQPISAPTRMLLAELHQRSNGCPWVCPGRGREKPLVAMTYAWFRIRKQAGLDDVRLHDLRHSFASIAAASGHSLLIIGRMLGHTQAATTQRYAHLADDPLRRANETVGSRVAAALRGDAQARVVPLR